MPLNAGKAFPVFRFANVLAGVGDVQVVGQFARPGNLVAHGFSASTFNIVGGSVFVALEPNGERFDVGVLFGQARGHVTGVDARGQEAANLDVSHVVITHAVAHGLVDGLDRVLAAALVVEVILRAPIAARGDGAVSVHGHAMCGRQLEDAFEERFGQRAELEAQVLLKCFAVKLARVGWVLKDALDFGREDELPVLLRVIERLDAKEIARAEQLACFAVPNGEREHAAQAIEHTFAPG